MSACADGLPARTSHRIADPVDGRNPRRHRFIQDVVRLEPGRALSQVLREQIVGWKERPLELIFARAPSIRPLRPLLTGVERPAVTGPVPIGTVVLSGCRAHRSCPRRNPTVRAEPRPARLAGDYCSRSQVRNVPHVRLRSCHLECGRPCGGPRPPGRHLRRDPSRLIAHLVAPAVGSDLPLPRRSRAGTRITGVVL
jgi:hypothetical protein